MTSAVIVSAVRSPIGRAFKGSLAGLRPDEMSAQILQAAFDAAPGLDPREIVDIHMGCAQPGGEAGFNVGKAATVLLGLDDVPSTVVNRACASSVQTTRMAQHAILAGAGDIFVSAGVESVSAGVRGTPNSWPDTKNPVFDAAQARTAQRASGGADTWVDPRSYGELPDYYIPMGQTAENVAQLCGVTREDQDAWALRSQQRYEAARLAGFWEDEITPLRLADGTLVTTDDSPRGGTTAEALAGLKPVFRPDGTVTAGNACPLSDGAAALVIMSDSRAQELGLTPLARIVSTAVSGLSPEIMGLGPVEASRRALAAAGLSVADLDLVEINEAFAAQVLPSARQLGLDLDRLNVHGGAIALGHPFGSTGARITTTLIHGLRTTDGTLGLETMCIGYGMGMAMVLERLS
ncbi:MAG: acetyl-CoA acetyltransferase [Frankiales bacterium]|nr:acetyl-CoA acetyltransferase [Frankiales bacterium]